jgi:hypothetical protein
VGERLTHGDKVTFDLEVDNVTHDLQRSFRVRLLFDEDGSVGDYMLLES